mmetsp:Transcript_8587/g.34985  ORF Transcript_8587/g.34985 Transcript_8587/m.34985 type:complete len:649 (+) Transcript_8587:2635-4581(+)
MAATEHHPRLQRARGGHVLLEHAHLATLDRRDAREHEVVGGDGASLVEEARVDAAAVRDAKRLRAEDLRLHQRHERRVDRHGRLERQLGWHHARDNQHATQHELVLRALSGLEALAHDVGGRDEREEKQQREQRECFLGVALHLLRAVLDHADEATLARQEARAKRDAEAAAIRGADAASRGCTARGARLHERGAAEEHVRLVRAVDRERLLGRGALGWRRVLHQRGRLARQRRFVDDRRAADDEGVARDRGFRGGLLGARAVGGAPSRGVPAPAAQFEDIPGEQRIGAELDPTALAVHPDGVALVAHAAERAQILLPPEDSARLEAEDGEHVEERVLGILVQQPQARAKDLEDGHRPHDLLLVQLDEGRGRNVEAIVAIALEGDLGLARSAEPLAGMVLLEAPVGGADHLGHHGATLHDQELLPVEDKEERLLAVNQGALQRDELGLALVKVRLHVRVAARLERANLRELDERAEAHAPALREEEQRMRDGHHHREEHRPERGHERIGERHLGGTHECLEVVLAFLAFGELALGDERDILEAVVVVVVAAGHTERGAVVLGHVPLVHRVGLGRVPGCGCGDARALRHRIARELVVAQRGAVGVARGGERPAQGVRVEQHEWRVLQAQRATLVRRHALDRLRRADRHR